LIKTINTDKSGFNPKLDGLIFTFANFPKIWQLYPDKFIDFFFKEGKIMTVPAWIYSVENLEPHYKKWNRETIMAHIALGSYIKNDKKN